MSPWNPHSGGCELLPTARFPSVGQASPVGWLKAAPYGKIPEHGSKDGCLETPPHISIGS